MSNQSLCRKKEHLNTNKDFMLPFATTASRRNPVSQGHQVLKSPDRLQWSVKDQYKLPCFSKPLPTPIWVPCKKEWFLGSAANSWGKSLNGEESRYSSRIIKKSKLFSKVSLTQVSLKMFPFLLLLILPFCYTTHVFFFRTLECQVKTMGQLCCGSPD